MSTPTCAQSVVEPSTCLIPGRPAQRDRGRWPGGTRRVLSDQDLPNSARYQPASGRVWEEACELGRAGKLKDWTGMVEKVAASYPAPPIVPHRIRKAFSARSHTRCPVKIMDTGNGWDGGQVRTNGTYRVDDRRSRRSGFKSGGSRLCAHREQFPQPQPASSPPPHVVKYNPDEGSSGQDQDTTFTPPPPSQPFQRQGILGYL